MLLFLTQIPKFMKFCIIQTFISADFHEHFFSFALRTSEYDFVKLDQ